MKPPRAAGVPLPLLVCGVIGRTTLHSDDAVASVNALKWFHKVSEAQWLSSFACGATTGKDPRIREPRLRLLQLLATRQKAATARTGSPKRRTRRLSKDSEFCRPRGHLSNVIRNEADYQPAQLARVSPMPANVPARAQPTTAPPGANTVIMPKPTPKAQVQAPCLPPM